MPQMFPLYWTPLFYLFLFIMLLFIVKNFFFFKQTPNTFNLTQVYKKKINLKW